MGGLEFSVKNVKRMQCDHAASSCPAFFFIQVKEKLHFSRNKESRMDTSVNLKLTEKYLKKYSKNQCFKKKITIHTDFPRILLYTPKNRNKTV